MDVSNALTAFRSTNFDWAAHVEGIWGDPAYDVPELHGDVRKQLYRRLDDLFARKNAHSPLGSVMIGPAGSGKTHLLSALRKEALAKGAGFVLIDMTDVHSFEETALLGYLRSLRKLGPTGLPQFREILQHIVATYYSGPEVIDIEVLSSMRPPKLINRADAMIGALYKHHAEQVEEYQDVIRALVLLNSSSLEIANIGYGWLQGLGIDDDEKMKHGFRLSQMRPPILRRALSWLLSLKAPVVVALDQLDAIVAEHDLAAGPLSDDPRLAARQRTSLGIIEGISGGLMALRDGTRQTLNVVSCLEATWTILTGRTLKSSTDRYEPPIHLRAPAQGDVAHRMVERRLSEAYTSHGFTPPYPTWPFAAAAFASLDGGIKPRDLLKKCDAHVRACADRGDVTELTSFSAAAAQAPSTAASDAVLLEVDARYEALKAAADLSKLRADAEDEVLDPLIEAACLSLAEAEPPAEHKDVEVDTDFEGAGRFAPLHVRLRVVHRDQADREEHFCFRFLEPTNAIAFQARLNAAITASGVDRALQFRQLRILRSGPPPGGQKTKDLVERFIAQGGQFVTPADGDLRAMSGLAALRKQVDRALLDRWLAARKPVESIAMMAEVVGWLREARSAAAPKARTSTPPPPRPSAPPPPEKKPRAQRARRTSAPPPPEPTAPLPMRAPPPGTLVLGRRMIAGTAGDEPFALSLEALAKHVVVLAGSGSGKTVLVRRLVEEAALLGVPSIVVDVANDLARLGDPWPEKPGTFDDADVTAAERYAREVEVVVWTPGRSSGKPLRLDPLPDLSALVEDREELIAARDLVRAGLEPYLIASGRSKVEKQGLLSAALEYYAIKGGRGLVGLMELLGELPPEATGGFAKGKQYGQEMSEKLRGELKINPMLRAEGSPLDPGVLFGGESKRTRVSVVNLHGLPSLESQQSLVNQLAMTLFAWVKKNPAAGRAVRGLLVIDEAKDFVPSGKAVPSRDSLIRLAAQARKYGLGLVLATQEPKSIDHKIIANSATQLFGQVSSPAAIEVVRDQIRLRGGRGDDVAKLGTGRFYAYTEGLPEPLKIASRLCLTHHPKNPLDESGILERALRPHEA